MAASKLTLSGSTDGRGIIVAAKNSGSPGTTIHTGPTDPAQFDEVWLYAMNHDNVTLKLTIEYGGTTAPKDLFEQSAASKEGLYLIVPGLILKGNATPLVIKAFQDPINKYVIFGYVNRLS